MSANKQICNVNEFDNSMNSIVNSLIEPNNQVTSAVSAASAASAARAHQVVVAGQGLHVADAVQRAALGARLRPESRVVNAQARR